MFKMLKCLDIHICYGIVYPNIHKDTNTHIDIDNLRIYCRRRRHSQNANMVVDNIQVERKRKKKITEQYNRLLLR